MDFLRGRYYELISYLTLCRGAFSVVRRCVHKESKVEYAAKIINTRKLSSRGTFGKRNHLCMQFTLIYFHSICFRINSIIYRKLIQFWAMLNIRLKALGIYKPAGNVICIIRLFCILHCLFISIKWGRCLSK